VDELLGSARIDRLDVHTSLAEVRSRISEGPQRYDATRLTERQDALMSWLEQKGNPWLRFRSPRRDDPPPRSCGVCMCSIEGLEERGE
jgi:hypothetical protein